MPAAAVIPAPIAYAKVVAVESLVVELLTLMNLAHPLGDVCWCARVILLESASALDWVGCVIQIIYCE